MRFDFESAGPAVAYVDDAGILSRTLHHSLALGRQTLQMNARGLVGAVFAPHDAVNAELRQAGGASQRAQDALILVSSNAVLRE